MVMKIFITILLFAQTFCILAQKNYKGAEIYSSQSWKYGKVEMRMRMAKGSGILSTFFTYKNGSEIKGTFWEEIDIEVFGKNNADSFQSNIITNNPKKTSEEVHSPGFSMGDAYHTYTLEWTPNYVAWFIDGVLMRKTQGGQVSELTNAESFRFNLWAANITSWVGTFDVNALPAYQFVNWIKYSTYTPGKGNNGSDFTLNWTDDFNSFNTSMWSKADWTFNENLTDFDPNNALVKDGYLVLVLSKAGQTGFTGTVPVDQITNPTPIVSITSPTANAIFCSNTMIQINVNASVSSGNISKVDFYDGNTLIGTDNTSPYTLAWTSSTAGSKTIRAIATSNTNVVSSASTVNITVKAPTTISPYVQTNGGTWLQQATTQLCVGGSVNISPQPTVATGWSWTGPNGYTATTREIGLATMTETQGGKYTALYNDGTCVSTADFTVNVNVIPSAPTVASPVSYNQNTTALALTATGTALLWYTVATAGIASTNAPIPSTANIGTSNYYVSQTINTCESPRAQIDVVVKPAFVKQTIVLKEGWNLISTNVTPTDSSISTLFAGLDVQEIKTMDAFWRKGQNSNFNKLTKINTGYGYLVNMNVAGNLTINGLPLSNVTYPPTIKTGWQLIGCPFQTNTALSTFFDINNCTSIKNFDGFYIPNGTTNSISDLEVGKGYFFKGK